MAEEIIIHQGGKSEKYATLLPQMKGLLSGEFDRVANMANFVAALQTTFGFFWVGFYVVREEELVLAPFQGPVACTRIRHGKGGVAPPGKSGVRLWSTMWMLFPDTSHAAPPRSRRSLFR